MSQHLLSFAKRSIQGRSNAYLALLWCMARSESTKTRFSESIKEYLTSNGDLVFKKNLQLIASRFQYVLNSKPELDWVAPEGLNLLRRLCVKNFRGFGQLNKEDHGNVLNLSKVKNIFYAPNGGGKTSLCEALEFGTTGTIKEASRRKTKINKYISRGNEKHFLKLYDGDKKEIVKNLIWSCCFIDRNRLQEFSLLGSKDTGSQEKDVVATLFGLEDYQSVISRFVLPSSFSLQSLKKPDSTERLVLLNSEVSRIKQSILQQKLLISEQDDLACDLLNIPKGQLKSIRYKHSLYKKLIALKERKIDKLKSSSAPKYVKYRYLLSVVRLLKMQLEKRARINDEFSSKSEELNYRSIFDALMALKHSGESLDSCPACSTPISNVTEHPFIRAEEQLEVLKHLDSLKVDKSVIAQRIASSCKIISGFLKAIDRNELIGMRHNFDLSELEKKIDLHESSVDSEESSAELLREALRFHEANTYEIESYIDDCIDKEREIDEIDVVLTKLNGSVRELSERLEKFQVCSRVKAAAMGGIEQHSVDIVHLIGQTHSVGSEVEKDKEYNNFLDELVKEYAVLHADLYNYKFDLEKERISGIEVKALEYYQSINSHDDEHEKVSAIKFEKGSDGYRIVIHQNDEVTLDAFSVLSEGHLRVLGLSLLLAMAQKNKFPVIVFDDVVNAIDSDHRSNIIDLFFADPYLRKVQMIVTTHDRLFWERFCLVSEKSTYADNSSSYVLTYTNKGIAFINYAGGFRKKIEEALSMYDIRQALIYCRIWFESLVVDYCLDRQLPVTAQFNRSQLKKNNYLQISLEKTFGLVEPFVAEDKLNYNLIKNDLINWSGQNQEHHAFDEFGFNFVHSKTSDEVSRIFHAIRSIECELFPARVSEECLRKIEDIETDIASLEKKLLTLDRAPEHVRLSTRARRDLLSAEKIAAQRDHDYAVACGDALALRGAVRDQ